MKIFLDYEVYYTVTLLNKNETFRARAKVQNCRSRSEVGTKLLKHLDKKYGQGTYEIKVNSKKPIGALDRIWEQWKVFTGGPTNDF